MTTRTVVFAPDSFKGTVGASVAAALLAEGWRRADPEAVAVLRPMADGGEGTLDAFAAAVPGSRRMPVTVSGPSIAGSGATLEAAWLLLPPSEGAPGGTGVVELGSTAGIELYGDRLDPWGASTRGFGDAIVAALDHGVSRLVLAIGSSASTDGGAGVLAALGARIVGAPAAPAARDLAAVAAVDVGNLRPLPPGGALVLCDVVNPLLGARGAAAVFGPQKGFAAEELIDAEAGLRAWAAHIDVDTGTPGAGAAGGTGFGLLAWGAEMAAGAETVAELIGIPAAAETASVVVTGEGHYDRQSSDGKAPAHVAALAAEAGAESALVAGGIAPGADLTAFAAAVSLSALAGSADAAMSDPAPWLRAAGEKLARRFA